MTTPDTPPENPPDKTPSPSEDSDSIPQESRAGEAGPAGIQPADTGAPTPARVSAITGPLSVGDLLDRIFRVYRARFGVLVLTAALFLIPIAIVNGIITGQFMVGYLDFLQNIATVPATDVADAMGPFFIYTMGILGISLLAGLSSSVVNLAVSIHVLRFYDGNQLTVGEGIRRALPKLWRLILLYLTQALATFLTVVVIGGVAVLVLVLVGVAMGGVAMLALEGSEMAGPFAVVGMIVLLLCLYVFLLALIAVPVLYLSARWIVAVPALVNEGLGPIAALRRSWQLTVRNVWRSVFYLVLLFILSSLVVSVPLTVIQQVLMLLPIGTDIAIAMSTAIGSLFNVIWQPLYATGLVLLYFDLRVRRESYDVELQVTQLEQEVASGAR